MTTLSQQEAFIRSAAYKGFYTISDKNPVVTDDRNKSVVFGSRWLNTVSQEEFVCINSDPGAAVWKSTTAGGGPLPHTAIVNPAITDDSGDGYAIGQVWINTVTNTVFVATVVTIGAAIWKEILTSPLILAAVAAVTTAGAQCTEVTQDKHYTFSNGIGGWTDKCITSMFSSVSLVGVQTAISLISGSIRGTKTLPANFFKQGKVLRYRFSGVYTTDVVPGSMTLSLMIGGVTFRTTGVASLDSNVTNGEWQVEGAITCYTTGITGTVAGVVLFQHIQTTGAGDQPFHNTPMTTVGPVIIDTTAAATIDLRWSADDAGTSITCFTCRMWEVC